MIDTSNNAVAVILVLESDVLIRTRISEFLRECGYHVIEGVCAQDVWTVIQSGHRLDVVVSEVQLSGPSNGFSLTSELRQTHPGIDVILKLSELPQQLATRIHLLLESRRTSK